MLDIARGAPWPERYTARTLRNAFLDQWHDREEELAQDTVVQQAYRAAAARGDLDVVPVWAGEALDLITSAGPAAGIVADLAAEAEPALAFCGQRLTTTARPAGLSGAARVVDDGSAALGEREEVPRDRGQGAADVN